jgi:uncharacterized coiled-coil protein SlyX
LNKQEQKFVSKHLQDIWNELEARAALAAQELEAPQLFIIAQVKEMIGVQKKLSVLVNEVGASEDLVRKIQALYPNQRRSISRFVAENFRTHDADGGKIVFLEPPHPIVAVSQGTCASSSAQPAMLLNIDAPATANQPFCAILTSPAHEGIVAGDPVSERSETQAPPGSTSSVLSLAS